MSDPNTFIGFGFIGGGGRGHLSNEWFDLFLGRWGKNKNQVYNLANLLVGASVGGKLAASYAYGYSPADLRPFFLEKAKRVFTIRDVPIGCDADTDSNTPNLAQKALLFATNDPFYKSPCPLDAGNSNFGDNILQTSLIEKFGDHTLVDLKTNVLIPSLRANNKQFVVFSNIVNPFYEGRNEKIVDVLRATGAAPVYLPNYTFKGFNYLDGGLFANNMLLEAYQAAKILKPTATRFCFLSVGTGKGQYTFDGVPDPEDNLESVATQAMNLLGQTMDGQSESVHRAFQIKSSPYTLDNVYYYEFNPTLDPARDTALDNSKPEFFDYLTSVATTSFNNDLANIDAFIERLNV